ncbi:MAG: hypothetical protein NEHIOOID_00906 [Holosporales bacterium]
MKNMYKLAVLFGLASAESYATSNGDKIAELEKTIQVTKELISVTGNDPVLDELKETMKNKLKNLQLDLIKLKLLDSETEEDRRNPNVDEIRKLKADMVQCQEMLKIAERNPEILSSVIKSIKNTMNETLQKINELGGYMPNVNQN